MAHDLISRYIWIIDTLTRYGRLTRADLNRLWVRSSISEGKDLPERSFFHYRRAIEQNFNIEIGCNGRGEYFIEQQGSKGNRALTNMMLDSFSIGNTIRDSHELAGKIDIEDVPSARLYFAPAVEAIRNHRKISFSYAGFNRSRVEKDILFQPCFMKRYKQRWYMVGLREKSGDIRTYALDRVRDMSLLNETFETPENVTPDSIFGNIVGITSSKANVKDVRIQANSTQAKYLRALPLHPSQKEEAHDTYSIFSYRLKLNYELVHEILGYGDAVKVLSPPELKAMVVTQLRDTLAQYDP